MEDGCLQAVGLGQRAAARGPVAQIDSLQGPMQPARRRPPAAAGARAERLGNTARTVPGVFAGLQQGEDDGLAGISQPRRG